MSDIAVFNSDMFGTLRTVQDADGKTLFCGKDVATALGYRDPTNAVKLHCRGMANYRPIEDALGRTQNARFIDEGDLYRLIMSSKLPAAEKFEAWVLEDVLPAIRRHGAYVTDEMLNKWLADPETMIKTLEAYKQERERRMELEAQAALNAPKIIFADAVATSETTILVGELAKILKGNGIPIGGTRLFEWLRNNGYLIRRKGSDWNMPTQRSLELGVIKIKETTITSGDGHIIVNKTPKVTGKGQNFFVSRFLDGTFTINQKAA